MAEFRAYIVGPDGRFIGVHEIAAIDQNEAITKAISLLDGHAVEVWKGDDFIGTLKPVHPAVIQFFSVPRKLEHHHEPAN